VAQDSGSTGQAGERSDPSVGGGAAVNGDRPLVSICIPLYNKVATIGRTLNSATAQTYSNVEILVLDNGSTDGSGEVVREWAAQDGRVKYVRLERTMDVDSSWRSCLESSTGEFCRLLGADDLMHSEFVAAMAGPLLEKPELDFTACRTGPMFDVAPIEVNRAHFEALHNGFAELVKEIVAIPDAVGRARRIAERSVMINDFGDLSAVLFRRRCFPAAHWEAAKGPLGGCWAQPDWDFLVRLYAGHRGQFVDRLLGFSNHSLTHPVHQGRSELESRIYTAIKDLNRPLSFLTDPTLTSLRAALTPTQFQALVNGVNQHFEALFALVQQHDAQARDATEPGARAGAPVSS
jgi:glycosyltransferase involved in cell wall biosynthesis